SSTATPNTLTPRHCFPPSPRRIPPSRRSGSCSRAMCPAPSIRPRAAASTPGAPRLWTSARWKSPSSWILGTATSWPATWCPPRKKRAPKQAESKERRSPPRAELGRTFLLRCSLVFRLLLEAGDDLLKLLGQLRQVLGGCGGLFGARRGLLGDLSDGEEQGHRLPGAGCLGQALPGDLLHQRLRFLGRLGDVLQGGAHLVHFLLALF